jgi:hypothetical protein
MANCNCTKTDQIDQLKKDSETILHILRGDNPPPGLIETVNRLVDHTQILPIIQEQLGQLLTLKAIDEDRKKSWQYKIKTGLAVLSVIVVIVLGFFNLRNTTTTATAQENIVVTDPATLENALREGKNPRFRDGAAIKQYEKNYQEGIKSMNK